MSDEKVDGYWLKMGALMTDTLVENGTLPRELPAQQCEALSEYFGGVLDDAYKMGIRFGELAGQFKARTRSGA